MSRNFKKKQPHRVEWSSHEVALPWFAYLIISSGSSVQSLLFFCGYHAVPKWCFFYATQIQSDHAIFMPLSIKSIGGKRFSQPGTCDVDVVLLARYASRAIDMKQATGKLTAHEMPRMPMVKTTASMKEFPRQKHLLKMHSDCKGFPQNIQKPKSFSSLNLQKNHSMIEDWTPSTGFPMDEVFRYVVFPWSQVQ